MGFTYGENFTRLYRSHRMGEKEMDTRTWGKGKGYSLKSELSSQNSYNINKSYSADTTMSDYHFEIFTTLNDKIRPQAKKNVANKYVNTDSPKHEHNNFFATITIKCKECDVKFRRELEF
ncbi:trophozoite stage antigen [Plasmodium ovale wallikeri]|uniref:Trophozoite stage antigen n=2 Tax=Plasmodium ovale TaxID=36330 RepID=A0A1A8YPZ3_PLAOA|nr:trophozoite stage antigen [Plasmodium ovale wallikeri]SBT34341.1 trophozoite stage antigen [Plasmodium ovale wallikeri]SBT76783.1 trophozoite stage antigen, putative [Plasmodium ovale]